MSDAPSMFRGATIMPWQRPAAVGILAWIVCIVGGLFDPLQFMRAYLPAWIFFWGLALGSMILLMIYHLVGGAWGYLLRRILEAGMRTMPLVAAFFVPIAVESRLLYPWAQPELVAASAKLQHESFYLNRTYFLMRAAAYFVLWLTMAYCFSSWSRAQDRASSKEENSLLAWRCNQLSAYGAVVYGITLHFAAVDWTMSLMPAFHSTIWGPMFAVGQLLSALGLAVIMFADRANDAPLSAVASLKAVNDMGSLLFTFLVACAYMAWFQFMLIWIANLPVDIIFYLPRTSAFWLGMIWAIVVLHFAVPFFLLLMRPIKSNVIRLARVARLIVVMHLVYIYYQITPMFPATTGATDAVVFNLTAHWIDFLMPIAMGGIWLAYFRWQIGRYPPLVAGDEQLVQALHLRHLDEEEASYD